MSELFRNRLIIDDKWLFESLNGWLRRRRRRRHCSLRLADGGAGSDGSDRLIMSLYEPLHSRGLDVVVVVAASEIETCLCGVVLLLRHENFGRHEWLRFGHVDRFNR